MSHFNDENALSFKDVLIGGNLPQGVASGAVASSYAKLLEGPVALIACNVPERADAISAAILGYN